LINKNFILYIIYNNMPNFLRTPFTYIKTIIIFAPILISSCAILLSAYNFDSKGIFYVIGTLINTFFGWLFARGWPRPKPGMRRSTTTEDAANPNGPKVRRNPAEDLGSVNCSIFGLDANWGIEGLGSTPDSHALFLAFTFIYILLGATENSKGSSSIILLVLLGIFMLLSGAFRTSSMKCCQPWDVLIGWVMGSLIGFGWFACMMLMGDNLNLNVTYFSDPPGNSKCNLSDKEYKCDIIGEDIMGKPT